MVAKFSDHIKESIALSRYEAIRMGNDYLGVEHLVLGLIRSGDNSAVNCLLSMSVDLEKLKFQIEQHLLKDPNRVISDASERSIPLTLTSEKILKSAYLEAKIFKSETIRSVHLLARILKERESVVTEILNQIGVGYSSLSTCIIEKFSLEHNDYDVHNDLDVSNQLALILNRALIKINDHIEPVIGVKDISKELVDLIINLKTSDKGKMIGVFGGWGRGKTFLIKLILEEMNVKSISYKNALFHAWKYQDTPAIWAYLYESLANVYYKDGTKKPILKGISRLWKYFRLNLERNGYYSIVYNLIFFGVLYVSCKLLYINAPFLFDAKGEVFKGFAVAGFVIPLSIALINFVRATAKEFHSAAMGLFKKYYGTKSFGSLLGTQAEIQKEIKSLLKCWLSGDEKLLLVVDDIDRCNEDKIMQIIDSLRIMLDDEYISARVVVLAAIDERILRLAVKRKYYDFIDKDYSVRDDYKGASIMSNRMVAEYLDKLFIAGVKLSKLSLEDKREFFSAFTKGQVSSLPPVTDEESALGNELIKQGLSAQYNLKSEKNAEDARSGIDEYAVDIKDTGFALDSYEYDHIHDMIGLLSMDMTPRQIRIFYYRYLMARNIFFKRYNKFKNNHDVNESRVILSSILALKCFDDSNVYEAERLSIFFSTNAMVDIKVLSRSYKMDKELMLEMFSAIEMVVGY